MTLTEQAGATLDAVHTCTYTGDMKITVKPADRIRKPVAPRTCCETHTDTCKFGRQHSWSIGWFGGPKSGVGIGTEGWHDSMICVGCMGICMADLAEGDVA